VVIAKPEDVDHKITVLIQIQEGRRLRIEAIDLVGNTKVTTEELRNALPIKAGDIYIPSAIDQARAVLTQFYYSRGYADARVERMVDRTNGGVHVVFQTTEGESYLVGMILVAGNTRTKDKVIRRSSG